MASTPQLTERVRLWRPTGLAGVEALHYDGESVPGSALTRVYHDTYTLCVHTEGGGTWRYRRRDQTQRPGGTMLMEPGELHVAHRLSPRISYRVLMVPEAEVLAACPSRCGIGRRLHLSTAQVLDRELRGALLRFHSSLLDGNPRLDRQSSLIECLSLLVARYAERPRATEPRSDKAAVARARAYVHDRWAEDVSLDDLADAAGASKWHLVRQFRETIGLPPHAYLVQVRVAKAKDLLGRGVPIARVAAETGFAAQSHLHRHFLRAYGVTPGQYQRSTT